MKIRIVGTELFRADKRTDMMKEKKRLFATSRTRLNLDMEFLNGACKKLQLIHFCGSNTV